MTRVQSARGRITALCGLVLAIGVLTLITRDSSGKSTRLGARGAVRPQSPELSNRSTRPFSVPASPSFFLGLGEVSEGYLLSAATGVSGDGLTVVGYRSVQRGSEAFRWRKDSGYVALGRQRDTRDSGAYACIPRGGVVVGAAVYATGPEACRWTEDNRTDRLGKLTGQGDSVALAASEDGSVVIGYSGNKAFHWTATAGMVELGPFPAGTRQSRATGVSEDGSVVVGSFVTANQQQEAFRWTEAIGVSPLERLQQYRDASANAVSADGRVIVGVSGDVACMWTESGGPTPLDDSRHAVSAALAVSADGSVIAGFQRVGEGIRAAVWDAKHGFRPVHTVLANDLRLAESLAGWTLSIATGISADGRVVVGSGINPKGRREAWMARLGD